VVHEYSGVWVAAFFIILTKYAVKGLKYVDVMTYSVDFWPHFL